MSAFIEVIERDSPKTEIRPEELRSRALYPPREQRQFWDDFLTKVLIQASDKVAAGPVIPVYDRATIDKRLKAFDFKSAKPLDEILPTAIDLMLNGVVHANHPRYFGLFNPAPSFPAQCADRISAAFNPQLATAVTSPAAVAIEAHTIGAIAARAGLPNGSAGHFTSGGSEANYTSLLCALTDAHEDFAAAGSRAFSGPPTFYVSRECHLAWVKIAHQAGIGRSGVRLVPTDGSGRMDIDALRQIIRTDRAERCVPIMIAATAGTTNAGTIDPLVHCAEVAREEKLWYHIDAAWGGAAIVSDRLRPLLAGIELADSVTIDAHKWFATTMGCGMFITARPAVLSSTFHVSANFMPACGAGVDPYVTTAQWSRRFAGLRLFLSLAAAGWQGYAQHVEKSVALGEKLAERLKAAGWRILNNPSLAVVCAVPPDHPDKVRQIAARVVASGRAWASAATFEGRDVIRACVTHGETTIDDVDALVDSLGAALDGF